MIDGPESSSIFFVGAHRQLKKDIHRNYTMFLFLLVYAMIVLQLKQREKAAMTPNVPELRSFDV